MDASHNTAPVQGHSEVDLERAQPRRPWRGNCNFFRILTLLLVVCLELCRGTLSYLNIRLGGLVLDCFLNSIIYPIIQLHEWRVEDGLLDAQSGIVHGASNWWMKTVRIFLRRPETTTFTIPTPLGQLLEVQLQYNQVAAFRSDTSNAATREETREEIALAASSSHIHPHLARRVWSRSVEETCNNRWRETSCCNEALFDSCTPLGLCRNTASQTLPIQNLQGPAVHRNGNQDPIYHPTPVTHDRGIAASSPIQGSGSSSAIASASASNLVSGPNAKETTEYFPYLVGCSEQETSESLHSHRT